MWISTVLVEISERTVITEQTMFGWERNRRSGAWLESLYLLMWWVWMEMREQCLLLY
jgi:hypothetical protein